MQQLNIPQIGRIVGLAIIIIGFLLSIWLANDLGDFVSDEEKFRFFAQEALTWLAFGAITYLAAEILDNVSSKREE